MDFAALANGLIDWVVRIGATVNDMPGTLAFALGLFTWFAVEQILQRVMNGLRWVIVIGALGALGVGVPYVAGIMLDRGSEAAGTQ